MPNQSIHLFMYPWQLQKYETKNSLTTLDSGFMEMFDCDVYGDWAANLEPVIVTPEQLKSCFFLIQAPFFPAISNRNIQRRAKQYPSKRAKGKKTINCPSMTSPRMRSDITQIAGLPRLELHVLACTLYNVPGQKAFNYDMWCFLKHFLPWYFL